MKKPKRIIAIGFIMMLCLLVYKQAELRLRQQLAATAQSMPSHEHKPTQRPTIRWLFQCFEGMDLRHTLLPDGSTVSEVLRLAAVHRLVLHLLSPRYEYSYFLPS